MRKKEKEANTNCCLLYTSNMPLSYYDEFGAHYAHMKKIFTDGMRSIGIPFTLSLIHI